MESMSVENNREDHDELIANIRRLTIMVLDNLETGTRDRTLDQGQKRLLSSTGTRLLRLWTAVLREGESERVADELHGVEEALAGSETVKQGSAKE